jgi:hypothetical protein
MLLGKILELPLPEVFRRHSDLKSRVKKNRQAHAHTPLESQKHRLAKASSTTCYSNAPYRQNTKHSPTVGRCEDADQPPTLATCDIHPQPTLSHLFHPERLLDMSSFQAQERRFAAIPLQELV